MDLSTVVGAATGSGGNIYISMPYPDSPLFIGDFYFQIAYLAIGANALGVQATQGLQAQVR